MPQDIVVADPSATHRLAAAMETPATTGRDAPELLDVQVQQLAGVVALVALGAGAVDAQACAGDRVQLPQQRDLVAVQDGRWTASTPPPHPEVLLKSNPPHVTHPTGQYS
jgi:hypothetical protein